MATIGPVKRLAVTSNGGNTGGHDPDRPCRLPTQCDELGAYIKF